MIFTKNCSVNFRLNSIKVNLAYICVKMFSDLQDPLTRVYKEIIKKTTYIYSVQ